MSAQFTIRAVQTSCVETLMQRFNIPRFVATILVARGITTPDEAQHFLNPSLQRDWHNPYDIPEMQSAVDVIEQALHDNKRIVVFGDFDVDGLSATALLTRALRDLGAQVDPFIPRRIEEGYALSDAAFQRMNALQPQLVITVDCGISCKNEVDELLKAGIDVVITDHHEPSDQVPVGVPVVDPKCVEQCPSAILAGAGVALKLVQVLGARFGKPNLWLDYIDFATLGTIADLMPMVAENRALVYEGLQCLNTRMRPCFVALLESAGQLNEKLNSTNISYSIIPRLNATGRMGDSQKGLDILLCDSLDEARELARGIEQLNEQRRSVEMELSEMARVQADEVYHGQRALVVAGENWHEGVKGIVASRLTRAYGVPSILFSIDGDLARGSGRSVGSVNLFKALEACDSLLVKYGGHEAAVGLTLHVRDLPAFTQQLCAYMDTLEQDKFHPRITVDAAVSLDELTFENVEMLEHLAPFGQENKPPLLIAQNVSLTNMRAVGADKSHLSCILSDGINRVAGIMFHCSDIQSLLNTTTLVSAAFEVQIDEWRGKRSIKAMLKSVAPAVACRALEACLDPKNVQFVSNLYATSDEELCTLAPESPALLEENEQQRVKNRHVWQTRAQTHPQQLEAAIIEALIGAHSLHESQQQVLEKLDQGLSVFAVMATGRGKSLTFQVYAALKALRDHQASLFIYPLRALIADQAYHLENALSPFGISVQVLSGESSPEERKRIYDSLQSGMCDIVLTTPEYLEFHAQELGKSGRISFVVVDEAHHIGMARAGKRPAYANLGEHIACLGNVQLLALTATADGVIARDIARELNITACVFDQTQRQNLHIIDKRDIRDKEEYLANLVAQGEKTVIYVSTREQSVLLARSLRARVPQLALLIGFYNAGLSRRERIRVEQLFRTGSLTVLVSTSAFGEGVNIGDITHVVLYGMPYNDIEFNQMSGRAGRNGAAAYVHLVFGRADINVNQEILAGVTPNRDRLARIYRFLAYKQRHAESGAFSLTLADIATESSDNKTHITSAMVECALAVFRELGLIECRRVFASGEDVRHIRVLPGVSREKLTNSARYCEGLEEKEAFEDYRVHIMQAPAQFFQDKISRPILPSCAHLTGNFGKV